VHALLCTQAGSGALVRALPLSISSFTHWAIWVQPADCQVSNGPTLQPKPQRIAKSMSRALSAIESKWNAM